MITREEVPRPLGSETQPTVVTVLFEVALDAPSLVSLALVTTGFPMGPAAVLRGWTSIHNKMNVDIMARERERERGREGEGGRGTERERF